MQTKPKKFEAHIHQGLFWRNTTYLAKIAVVLQEAPGKMLTFTQLMDRLTPLICEDRKSIDNNIRVCLSTHKCFVKIPVILDSFQSKRNYWKLDISQISAKMARRHFRGILQLFPELTFKLEKAETSRSSEHCSRLHSPEPAACKAAHTKCEAKFHSPFSIDSILKRDSPSARPSRPSPLSSVQVRAEQQPRITRRQVQTKRGLSWDSEPLLIQASPGSFIHLLNRGQHAPQTHCSWSCQDHQENACVHRGLNPHLQSCLLFGQQPHQHGTWISP